MIRTKGKRISKKLFKGNRRISKVRKVFLKGGGSTNNKTPKTPNPPKTPKTPTNSKTPNPHTNSKTPNPPTNSKTPKTSNMTRNFELQHPPPPLNL